MILFCVLSLSATACGGGIAGGGDPAQFAQDYSATTDTYQSELAAVQAQGRRATSTDPKQVAGVFDQLRGVTQRARADYEQLDPPDAVAEPHAALLENLQQQGDVLARVAAGTRAEQPDTEALKELANLLGEFAATQQLLAQRLAEDG